MCEKSATGAAALTIAAAAAAAAATVHAAERFQIPRRFQIHRRFQILGAPVAKEGNRRQLPKMAIGRQCPGLSSTKYPATSMKKLQLKIFLFYRLAHIRQLARPKKEANPWPD